MPECLCQYQVFVRLNWVLEHLSNLGSGKKCEIIRYYIFALNIANSWLEMLVICVRYLPTYYVNFPLFQTETLVTEIVQECFRSVDKALGLHNLSPIGFIFLFWPFYLITGKISATIFIDIFRFLVIFVTFSRQHGFVCFMFRHDCE